MIPVVGVILGGLLLAIGIWVVAKPKKVEETTEKVEVAETVTEVQEKRLSWKDEAGFVFNYPESWKIKQNVEDNESYANLEVSKEGKQGMIKILAKDTKLKTTAEWKEGSDNKIGRVDEGVLFTIEADAGWETEMKIIDESWQFFYPTKATVSSSTEEAVEVEEITDEE